MLAKNTENNNYILGAFDVFMKENSHLHRQRKSSFYFIKQAGNRKLFSTTLWHQTNLAHSVNAILYFCCEEMSSSSLICDFTIEYVPFVPC